MIEGTDRSLLERFATAQDETAFRALVGRHLALVHSTARRVTANEALARDVAQAAFVRLAQRAAMIPAGVELAAWLHRTTRSLAIDLVRRETRRRKYEAAAATMETPHDDPEWPAMAPVIDELVDALPATDRQLLILRYYRNEPHAAVAASLGLSDVATRKRTSRALEKLRVLLGKKGIATSASALATLLPAHAATPAPAALMTTVVSAAQGVAPLVPGSLHAATLAMNATQKSAIAAAAVLFLGSLGYAIRPATGYGVAESTGTGQLAPPQATAGTRTPRPVRSLPATPEARMQKLREILTTANSAHRRSELIAFTDTLPLAEFPGAMALLGELDSNSLNKEIEIVAEAWTRLDGPGALAAMDKVPRGFSNSIMKGLGANDPGTALAWLQSHPQNFYAYGDLLSGMAAADLPRAITILKTLPQEKQGSLLYSIFISMEEQADSIARLTSAMGRGPALSEMLASASGIMATTNPAGTFEMLMKDPEALRQAGLKEVFNYWMQSDIPAATAALEKLPAGNLRTGPAQQLCSYLSFQQGPDAALAVVDRLPGETGESLPEMILSISAGHDPGRTLDLIPRISNEAKRDELQIMCLQEWQRVNATAAQAWMNSHELSAPVRAAASASPATPVYFR